MATINKSLSMTHQAAGELIKYIEKLAHSTWIDVDRLHIPVRKALHFVDGEGSGWGARITFDIYKEVVEKVHRDQEKLEDKDRPKVDSENENFADDVKKLQNEGLSPNEAIDTVSGFGNLQMLAEGAIEGIIQIFESIVPADAIPEQLREPIDPIRDFMAQGVNEVPPQVNNFLTKLSPGWKYLYDKGHETSYMKVLNYAHTYAVNHAGSNVAKLWEAWAMYPTLKEIQMSSIKHLQSLQEDNVVTSNESTLNPVGDYVDGQIQHWNEYIRRAAVLFSNVAAQSIVCCWVGTVINLEAAKDFIDTIRSIVTAVNKFNLNDMNFGTQSLSKYSQTAQQATVSAILSSLNSNFNRQVNELRDYWKSVENKLGAFECVPLEQLFDGLIGILADMKNKLATRLRALVRWQDGHWNLEAKAQFGMMETNQFSRYLELLDLVEKILDLDARCPLEGDSGDSRAVDLINKLDFENTGLDVHIAGSPLPKGMDPEYPLANLQAVQTPHGLTIEPGIQGSNLPNEELEELFRRCRQGRFESVSEFTTLPGIFRRK